MSTPNDDHLDAGLTAVALIEAAIAKDTERVAVLLAPVDDAAPIVQYLLWLVEKLLTNQTQGNPGMALGQLRTALLQKIAENGDEGP